MISHIQAIVLRQRGGSEHWKLLEAAVKLMSPAQQQAFYRTLVNAKDDGVAEGRKSNVGRRRYL